MNQLKPMIILLLMLTSALAGCTGDDTSDLEQQIADLQQSNDEMNETINYQSGQIGMWYELDRDNQEQLAILESMLEVQQDLVTEWIVRGIYNDFSAVNLNDAELIEADLRYADLYWAQLYNANLSNADLRYADLENAELSYADLNGADLRYADLYYANLLMADLTGADLTGAGLTGVYWYDTTCPDGTNSDNNENTCEYNL